VHDLPYTSGKRSDGDSALFGMPFKRAGDQAAYALRVVPSQPQ
jgi:hypothetical protein